MKHRVYQTLSILIALALLAGLPVPVLAEDAASPSENWDYTIVQDHVPTVVSMGDSFSSGEGARRYFSQDEPIEKRVRDQDWLGHRGETAWSGLLTFKDENGRDVALNTLRFDKESPDDLPAKDARWFFVASSGAQHEDYWYSQGKAYSVRVFKTPKGADTDAQYMTVQELQAYYANSDGKLGLWDTIRMMANELDTTILEDNEKGWDEEKKSLRAESLIDPQMAVFSLLPGGGESVDYVTLTLGGNDLGFTKIVTTAATDVFQDIVQSGCELLEKQAIEELGELGDMSDDAWKKLLKALVASTAADVVESHGKLAKMLDSSLKLYESTIKASLRDVYADISKTAKNAVILVAGYPLLLDGATANALFSEADIRLINSKVAKFNELLAELIRQCREGEDGMRIYFVPVDGEGAFAGRGAYSKSPLISPVLLKLGRQVRATANVVGAAGWVKDPVMKAIITIIAKLGPEVLEVLREPEENEASRKSMERLKEFFMLNDEEWPGFDQELVTVIDLEEKKPGNEAKKGFIDGMLTPLLTSLRVSDFANFVRFLSSGTVKKHANMLFNASSASIHPTVEGHEVYAKCVQEYIETRVPIEVTGTVRQTDENLALSPAPSGSKVVLRLKGGPVSEGSERLSDLKQDDEVYKGAVQGEYTAAIAKDGSFKVKALSGTYELEVQDKDGNALLLYGMDGKTSVEVELMHHNSKGLDVRVMAMQEISGRVFAYDEDGNPMDIDCALYPVEMNFANVGMNDTRDGVRMPGGEVVENQAHDAASIVGSFALESIPRKGTEYKLRVPIGTTGIALWTPLTGVSLPLYDNDTGVIWVDVTAEKPVRQDMILKVENVQLIGRVTAKDSSGFPRDYDLSQYPLELELSQGKKKETWSTESVSANGTTFSMEMAPGDYTIRLAGQYKKAGYSLSDAKDNALTLTLPMGKPTTHDLSISVSDQKLSGTVYACTRDGDRVDCDFGEGNPLLLKFLDADGNEVASWETASIGKRGAGYSLMLPPGTYTVAAATKDGAAMGVHSDSDEAFTVTIPLGASAKSDIMLDVKNRDYLGTWSNEITVSGFMGVSAGVKLSLEIEESKITLKMAETADMSALGGLGMGNPLESGGNEETYEGTWSETDDGIAMDFSDGKVYFTRLNDDQLYLDLDRLEQDTAAQGSANAYLLELLRTLSYMDVGSMMGMFGGFDMEFGFNMNDMMGVDSMDDIFVFTREK